MKHLEDAPSFICNKEDENYITYIDTDSLYIHALPILQNLYPNFNNLNQKEKDNKLEALAFKYQNIITDSYSKLASECFNASSHRLEMKTEMVIRAAYFRSTRRYAQWITKQEGIVKEKLDIKGLEFKKANFPPVLGKFFKLLIIDILKGMDSKEIENKINKLRTKVLSGDINFIDLGNPTAVKTLNNYIDRKASKGEIFSTTLKRAPAAVKSAVVYNDLVKFWKLNDKHNYISQGDKIKWVYLKSNIYQIEAIAFLDYDIPNKIREFIEENIDRNKIFESILMNKLRNLCDDLGWYLSLNSFKDKFFNL